MTAYSHRDRRAQRAIWRCLGIVGAAIVALSAFILLAPSADWGILGIGGLIVTGGAYVVWSQQALSEYAWDLRAMRDGAVSSGFLRAEAGSLFGLDRIVGRPTERSPNTRRRRPVVPPDQDPGLERLELR